MRSRGINREQLIALAGVFQACRLVEGLARTGSVPTDKFATAMHSLFEQNPDSAEAVFGGLGNLTLGMETIHELFTMQGSNRQPDTLRYVIGALHLQGKLFRNRKLLQKIGAGIDNAKKQAEHFSETHENVVANLADLYQQTISTFRFRIQVSGFAENLQQPPVANRVRCLLFAAIRAAILWQQVGGRRWHLMFRRKQMLAVLKELENRAPPD